jgi:calcium-translocating P-type ATPase
VDPAVDRGLTASEVEASRHQHGRNELPAPARPSALRQLVAQVTSFFALMLWVAGVLAFVAGLPALGVAIFVVVVINGVFSFVEEYRADRAADRLQALIPRRVTVRRGGVAQIIDAADVVVGDVLVLGAGDRIPADASAVEVEGLRLDTSMLTGESEPTPVEVGDTVFGGTFVTSGEGLAVVVEVGASTRLAGISHLTVSTVRRPSPLAVELHRVVRTIAVIAVCVGVVFFGLSVLLGTELSDGFIFAVGVTVALVPEGLLPTVTLSLAVGAQRMAERHALVRHLEAVETLGSTTFICSDKTGTLTMNRMSVVAVWTPLGEATVQGRGYEPEGTITASDTVRAAVVHLAEVAARPSTSRLVERDGTWEAEGDPMEVAIEVLARRSGLDMDEVREQWPEQARFPFDPERRRMSVAVDGMLLVKGAPEAVLPRCGGRSEAQAALERLADRGLRVLAIAERHLDTALTQDDDPDAAERDLTLLGLIGLQDPPRRAAAPAIAACRRAGIRVGMITGDHPTTALAIARQLGLQGPDEVLIVHGDELPEDDQVLGALVDRDGIVISRVSPEDKLRIARALQQRGHVVAMTGDGVNDGPALHQADIGVAMGRSGTDVARESADLVLLDDDFATIVVAVELGRATFANIRKFLTYHLTDNVAELTPFVVWALSGGNVPLALGVLQILALDIGTDTLTAVALGAERPAPHTLDRPPVSGRLLDRIVARRAFGVLGPTEAFVEMAAFMAVFLAAGWRPGESFPSGDVVWQASGAAFFAVIVGQAANAFACRSTSRLPGRLGWRTNRFLLVGVAVAFAVAAFTLFVPPVADRMEQMPPTLWGWLVALTAAPAVLLADRVDKTLRHRSRRRTSVSM